MKIKKKLIEVALPLEAINRACKDDKDRKTGHIRNLHKWYAPMPLPAWRAALFASIIDDPSNSASEESADALRDDLFRVLEDVLPLDAGKDPRRFDRIREVIRAAAPDGPTVLDPFCGGGSTLLEAQRLGLGAIGSDLNPVPVLITTVLTRYPSLFADVAPVHPRGGGQLGLEPTRGEGLVQDVLHYAQVVGSRAFGELSPYFPQLRLSRGAEGELGTVMSWIWSRTAKCQNPACGLVTPLASSFELTRASRGTGVARWIQPRVARTAMSGRVEYSIGTGHDGPPPPAKLGRGARFRCLGCATVMDETYIRDFAQTHGLGFDLMACVAMLPNGQRAYLGPDAAVRSTVTSPHPSWFPDLELSTHPQYMGAPRYGMRRVGDLFTARQLMTIEVFSRHVSEIRHEIERDAGPALKERAKEYAGAVSTVLALCVSKLAQSHNVLVRWKIDSRNGSGKPLPALDTQTVPAVWDFAENNPFGGSVGDWSKTVVPTALRAFDYCVTDTAPATVYQSDARKAATLCHGPVIVATDPPYYDSIPYADLSDLFYPLLRRMLHDVHPTLLATIRAPRAEELVADYVRSGDREKAQEYFYEGFRTVFAALAGRMRDDTPMTVVYSFKQQETRERTGVASTGWEVLLRALLEAGFMVTATWPVRTTLENRSRDIESNAIASAILIVCRVRRETAATISRRELIAELRQELPIAIRRLQGSSLAPVDLQQAMIGPGMAVFSKHRAVLEADGKTMEVRAALELINKSLDELLAEQEGDFDPDSRWALTWFEQCGFEAGDYGLAETLSKAKNTSVEGMREAGILDKKSPGGKVRLMRPDELPPNWDPTKDTRLTAWEVVHHLVRVFAADGEVASAALVRQLGSKADTARELAYRLYAICERKKRASEALSYNGLVQSWPEIVRLAQEGTGPRIEQGALFPESEE